MIYFWADHHLVVTDQHLTTQNHPLLQTRLHQIIMKNVNSSIKYCLASKKIMEIHLPKYKNCKRG